MMKPRVFLSHSKADREFIERVANDLRTARIDVWYDEWELPVGTSFRKRIFEQGIPESDLFFVYITPTSAKSYWVERELDAGFIVDAEVRGGFLAVFVDVDTTRESLTPDLRGLHCPVFNPENYERGLRQLISRAWEAFTTNQVRRARAENELELLRLQKANAEFEVRVARLEAAGTEDVERVVHRLQEQRFASDYAHYSLAEIFGGLAPMLAIGTWGAALSYRLRRLFYRPPEEDELYSPPELYAATGRQLADFIGPLVIARLVTYSPPSGQHDETYFLTELGARVADRLDTGTGALREQE